MSLGFYKMYDSKRQNQCSCCINEVLFKLKIHDQIFDGKPNPIYRSPNVVVL